MQKLFKRAFVLTAATAFLSLGATTVLAQQGGRGNFDPEQMRQRMMERLREAFEVKDDAEWKIISERIEKVNTLRREAAMGGGGMGMLFGRGPQGGGEERRERGERGDRGDREGRRGGARGFGGEANPETEALQKAIEAKAPADEIKAKLAKVRETRKQKEADLEKAQSELKEVLTVRQEATAVLMGLLK